MTFPLTRRQLQYIIGSLVVCTFFLLGISFGWNREQGLKREELLTAIEETSREYQTKAGILLGERLHCSFAEEIERELQKLEAVNASRRRQLQFLDILQGKKAVAAE